MKKIIYTIFYLIISIFLCNCGIPAGIDYLEPPEILALSSDKEVGFSQSASVIDIVGYEIYYKIYKSDPLDDEISSDYDKFDISHDEYNFMSGSGIPLLYKFQRLLRLDIDPNTDDIYTDISLTSTTTPFVLQDDIDGINFVLEMVGGNNEINYGGVLKAVPIRNAKDSEDNYKYFTDLIDSSDSDNNVNNLVGVGDLYTIAFVAYSVAVGVGNLYQDSRPVYLGTIEDLDNN